MPERFEIIIDAHGKYRWRLKSSNGDLLAHGGTFDSRESARQSIARIQAGVTGAHVLDLTAITPSSPRTTTISHR